MDRAMEALTLETLARYCGGLLLKGKPSDEVRGVSTDTRSLARGDVFVALKGDHYNGHDFLADADGAGAGAVIVSDLPEASEGLSCGIVRVANTLKGLQHLARNYRDSLDIVVVGITGSSGKTSTKDFLGSVLAEKFAVNATEGNLNNHIGLPLTILRTNRSHDCGVWEMGMSNPGEIEELAEIASPDVGIITNVGVAHIEFMKGRDAIALEKGMLAEAVPPEGCVVLSAEDDYVDSIRDRSTARVLTAGLKQGDLRAEKIRSSVDGCEFELCIGGRSVPASIPVCGTHMVVNALLAAATGMHLGLSVDEIVAGLSKAKLAGGRLQRKDYGGVTYIDDTYNANPESMRAAIDTLSDLPCEGRRLAVLGAMAELGEDSVSEHRSIGAYLTGRDIGVLVTVGDAAEPIGEGAEGLEKAHFADHAAAAGYLKEHAAEGDVVLVKGSRASRMEQILKEVTGE